MTDRAMGGLVLPQGILLLSDPVIAGMLVEDCAERFVSVEGIPGVVFDPRKRDDDGWSVLVRSEVARRLRLAADHLPGGLRLLLVEGYRPPPLQAFFFDRYLRELGDGRPGASADELRALASRYVSPPEVAPHCAGAAVDLTLCDDAGRELPMGCPVNASPEDSALACYTATSGSPRENANRQILVAAMGHAGFVNYPTEWWHWSFGDRYWAHLTGSPAAVYDAAWPPPIA